MGDGLAEGGHPQLEAGKGTPQIDLLARVMAILETPIEHVVAIAPDERYPGDWRVIKGLTQPSPQRPRSPPLPCAASNGPTRRSPTPTQPR